jgi:hypothetical protein
MKIKLGKFPNVGHRKIDVEIENFDTWSMDHSLALIILPMLIQLKNSKQGVPSSLVSDVGGEDYSHQKSFDFYAESHAECFDIACNRWEEILDKMIWSFQQIALEDYENKYHHGHAEYDWVETGEFFHNPITNKSEETYKMIDKNPSEHWYDHDGHKLHEERIQEGLELFGKYYRALWD